MNNDEVPALEGTKRPGVMSAKHVAWTTGTGVVVLAVLSYFAWLGADKPSYKGWTDLARTVVVAFAALGAIPAGYIAYRRQRTLETQREDAARNEETRQLEVAAADRRSDAQDFRTRFVQAAAQLGDDKAAIRLAGVHAMAHLADDWGVFEPAQRQICVNVLCAYVCLPWPKEAQAPVDGSTSTEIADSAELRVRQMIIRVIAEHLHDHPHEGAPPRWTGLDLDFSGAQFTGGRWDFSQATFTKCSVRFDTARFSGELIDFSSLVVCDASVSFDGATFEGGTVDFSGSRFIAGAVSFNGARFHAGLTNFGGAHFYKRVTFDRGVVFSGAAVNFGASIVCKGGSLTFDKDAKFVDGTVDFSGAVIEREGSISFNQGAAFVGGVVDLSRATVNGLVTVDGRGFHGTNGRGRPRFAR